MARRKGWGGVPGFCPGAELVAMPFTKPGLVCEPVVSADVSLVVFQVNEIYHDESLGSSEYSGLISCRIDWFT